VRGNDKKQGNGWIRLSDLTAASGLSSEEIIFGYWSHASEQAFDVIFAWDERDIKGKMPDVYSLDKEEMRDVLERTVMSNLLSTSGTFEDTWVRRGFAYTVLRLLALGVRPEPHQFA